MNKKILIIGNGGSGKTYLAKYLSKKYEIPLLHLDKEYWQNGWDKYPVKRFIKRSRNFILTNDSWIIEGTPIPDLEFRVVNADLIIFLDINKFICILRVLIRACKYKLFTTKDTSSSPAAKVNWTLIKWLWNFNKNKRSDLLKIINNCDKKPIVLKKNDLSLFDKPFFSKALSNTNFLT